MFLQLSFHSDRLPRQTLRAVAAPPSVVASLSWLPMWPHAFLTLLFTVIVGLSSTTTVSAQTETWTTLGPEGGSILSLAVDPVAPTTLYAGTVSGGIFKSTDGGGSWTLIDTGLTGSTVSALVIDRSNANRCLRGDGGRRLQNHGCRQDVVSDQQWAGRSTGKRGGQFAGD